MVFAHLALEFCGFGDAFQRTEVGSEGVVSAAILADVRGSARNNVRNRVFTVIYIKSSGYVC